MADSIHALSGPGPDGLADPLTIPIAYGPREYVRLAALGVNESSARVLARLTHECGTERGYWRHLSNGRPADDDCRAAHTLAQRRRRDA